WHFFQDTRYNIDHGLKPRFRKHFTALISVDLKCKFMPLSTSGEVAVVGEHPPQHLHWNIASLVRVRREAIYLCNPPYTSIVRCRINDKSLEKREVMCGILKYFEKFF